MTAQAHEDAGRAARAGHPPGIGANPGRRFLDVTVPREVAGQPCWTDSLADQVAAHPADLRHVRNVDAERAGQPRPTADFTARPMRPANTTRVAPVTSATAVSWPWTFHRLTRGCSHAQADQRLSWRREANPSGSYVRDRPSTGVIGPSKGRTVNGTTKRRLSALATATATASLLMGFTSPAQAACYGRTVQLLQTFQDYGTGCSDLNVSWANTDRTDINGTTYWGQYYSGGAWHNGAAGEKYMADGAQSPWKVFIYNVLPGTYERMRGYNGAYVTTQT